MRKILIVDDEVDFCTLLKKNLEEAGEFSVRTCSESTRALEQAKAFLPHLILLDVLMPGISGPELVERLKATPETNAIPVVFLTAIALEEELGQRKNMIGGRYMMAKPIEMAELLKVIETNAAVQPSKKEDAPCSQPREKSSSSTTNGTLRAWWEGIWKKFATTRSE